MAFVDNGTANPGNGIPTTQASSDLLHLLIGEVSAQEHTVLNDFYKIADSASTEGKYFTTSAEHAADYAKQAVKAFKDPPYTIIRTEVPTSSLPRAVSVDGGIPAYVVPEASLPGLRPTVLDTMPIPRTR